MVWHSFLNDLTYLYFYPYIIKHAVQLMVSKCNTYSTVQEMPIINVVFYYTEIPTVNPPTYIKACS